LREKSNGSRTTRKSHPTPQGMSSEDQLRPYHAKSGSETADTLAEVLEHAAAKEVAAHKRDAPKRQPKWMLPLGINLGVFAIYLLIAPPQWVVMDPIEGPPPAEQLRSYQVAIFLQAGSVEMYRRENGRLPDRTEDIPKTSPGVEYIRVSADVYQLFADVNGEPLVYTSTEDLNEFLGDALSRLGG